MNIDKYCGGIMKTKKSKLLKKMLFNKILISIVPICLLMVFIVVVTSSTNESNFKKIQQNTLTTGVEELSSQYENLLVMVNNLSKNVTITHFRTEEYQNEVNYELLETVKEMSLPRTFYSHFWFDFVNHEYMYSASGTTSSKADFNSDITKYFYFSNYSNEELHQLISECRKTTILPAQEIIVSGKIEEYVVILSPVMRGNTKKATVLAFLPTKKLNNFIGGSQLNDYGNIFLDSSGKVVYSDFNNNITTEIVNIKNPKKHSAYHIFVQETYFLDLTVYRLISLTYSLQGIYVIYISAAVISLVCVVYVIAYIFYSIKNEYEPIRNISENCAKYMYNSFNVSAELNDMQVLSDVLEFLRDVKLRENSVKPQEPSFGNEELKQAILEDGMFGLSEENEQRRVILLFVRDVLAKDFDNDLRDAIEQYFSQPVKASITTEYTYIESYYVFA